MTSVRAANAQETIDAFLGGKISLIQPKDGYRAAMDTVLLAAAVPAKPGQHVLEAGLGTGGASLALAARIQSLRITGVERDPQMRAFAQRNIDHNQMQGRVTVETGDVAVLKGDGSGYDHVMMNPPFLEAGAANAPPNPNKASAHMDEDVGLDAWIRFGLHHVRARGSITVIHRADMVDRLIACLAGSAGDIGLLPLAPRDGHAPKRVIVQARKGTAGRARILPPLPLHGGKDRYSPQARSVLEAGAGLNMSAMKAEDLVRID